MKRAMLLVVTLALAASPAASPGAEAQKKGDAAPQTSAPKKTKADAAKKSSGAKGSEKPSAAGKKEARTVNPADRAAVNRTKSVFMFAMETCDRPERCDASLRDDAERRFMDACRLCASAERCEAERDAIRAGQAKRRTSPCDE